MSAPRFVEGLSEVVLPVNDVARAVEFYGGLIGLEVEEAGENGAWLWTGKPERSARLGLALRSHTQLRERMAPGTEDSPVNPLAFAPDDLGQVHFALRVRRHNTDALVARLRSRNHRVEGPIDFRWMRAVSWFVRDPDGHPLELWSPDPG